MSPPRKYLIPNQDINILRTEKYQSLPPQLAKYCPGYKSLINMKNIIGVMRKKDTCIIALIMFYESKTKPPIKLYRVLSCVLYYIIDNYVCIDYLCCQSKTINSIPSDKIFEQASYNILLGIGIPEVPMDLLSCHVFMEKQIQL